MHSRSSQGKSPVLNPLVQPCVVQTIIAHRDTHDDITNWHLMYQQGCH